MIDRYAREHGEYFTPKTVLDIFTEFSKASSAILVPFTTKAQFISEIASVSEIDVLKSGILGEHLLDPIAKAGAHAVTAAKKSHYDLVILDPPFGIMAPEKQFGTRDRALIEFASSLSSLSENGLALGVFSQGILWRHTDKAWYQAIEDDGFHVNAVIELPSGTYSPYTNIGTVMLAVSRVRSNGYLSIESSASSPETIRSLLETLLTKPNSVHKLLRFPEAPYKYDLPSSLRSRNIVDTRLQKFGYPVINLLDACRDIRLTREQYGFLDEEGALFVPNIGTGNVVTSIADMTMKNHHNYFQLILNEAMIMPDYAAQMLNSDVGKLQRETLFTGAVIPKVSASSFKTIGLRIPVPPIDEQRKLIQLNNNIRASMNTLGAYCTPYFRDHKSLLYGARRL
jgi:predicted RNA methylase